MTHRAFQSSSALRRQYGDGFWETVTSPFTSESQDYSYEKLWMLPWDKRDVAILGVVHPDDAVVDVALGAKPGLDSLLKLDERATIKGGLTALYLAGVITENPSLLEVSLTSDDAEENALIKAAGVSTKGDHRKNLSKAAWAVRKKVQKQGKGLMRIAWALRALNMFAAAGILQLARSAAAALTLIAFPVIGVAVTAWAGISQVRLQGYTDRFNAVIERELKVYAIKAEEKRLAEEQKKKDAAAAKAREAEEARKKRQISALRQQGGTKFKFPWWGWVVGGVAVSGAIYALRIKK